MSRKLDPTDFLHTGKEAFRIGDAPTSIDPPYKGKKDYKSQLAELVDEIDELQNMMYAHDRYGLLLVFQAMDAAGKDSTIRAVMSGVNPHGISVTPFKRPNDNELDHDFLWRTTKAAPQRGRIRIFNRSYYEEVLVVRVHPEILTDYQRVPAEHITDLDQVWQQRQEDIRNLETYLHRNGIHVLKFFLNVSPREQARRFLRRLERPSKNWKFSEGDLKERKHWDAYMNAYESAINATATVDSPWCVVPANDKPTMRLIVATTLRNKLASLDMTYPVMDEARRAELQTYREQLAKEVG